MSDVAEILPIVSASSCCSPQLAPQVTAEEATSFSADLALLGHSIRLQILALLAQHDTPVCVCDLEQALPVKQPTVSHHLRLLREAGLIDCERRGLWAYYFLQREAMATLQSRVASVFLRLT